MSKSRPADPAVADRERGAFSGPGPQQLVNKRRGRPQQLRGPPYDIAVESYDCDTVPVFCKKNRISVAFYYKLKLQGKTPRELHLGNRRLISRESAEQWRREREAETAVRAVS